MLKKKTNKLIVILLSALLSGLIPAAVTLADTLIGDADGILVVNNGGNIVDGTHNATFISPYKLSPDETKSFYLSLGILKTGNNSERVAFPVTGTAAVTINPGGATLHTTSWTLGDYAIDTSGDFELEIISPTTPGWYEYEVTFTANSDLLDLSSPTTTAKLRVEVVGVTSPVDTTKPQLSYRLTPSDANGENDWYITPVHVEFIYSDELGGSGINPSTIPANYTLSTDGTHGPTSVIISDNQGNTQTVTVPEIKIDATAPTLTHTLDPESSNGNSGWYTSPAAVAFTANDPTGGSGLNTGSVPQDYSISVDGTHPETTYSVRDMAGNVGTTIVPEVKLDQTKPEISGHATTSPNANGWYNDDVTIRYDFSDVTSKISGGLSTMEKTISTEGPNQSSSHTVSDVAGNSETATVSGINIDKTKPVITINLPVEVPSYKLNEVVLADWSATDALSGLSSSSGTVASGLTLDTSSIGSKTFTVTATDFAGNTETKTVNYSVIYDFKGFFQPVDMNGVLNVVKAGSSIPIKFSLSGDMGLDIFNGLPAVRNYIATTNTPLDSIETVVAVTAGNSSLSFDPVTNQYTYVWKTDKLWAGKDKQLVVRFNDGTEYTANFRFK